MSVPCDSCVHSTWCEQRDSGYGCEKYEPLEKYSMCNKCQYNESCTEEAEYRTGIISCGLFIPKENENKEDKNYMNAREQLFNELNAVFNPSPQFNFINLTPHAVNVLDENNNEIMTIQPSGQVLRLKEIVKNPGDFKIKNIPVVTKKFAVDETTELPPRKNYTYYIVSLAVAQAIKRNDFIVPDDLVRDEQGRIIGCRRFSVIL